MPDLIKRVAYDVARSSAAGPTWREKVFAYVTRQPDELLVFAHTEEYPHAGIQVPAGGVEPGEDPSEAVVRELYEESGLRLGNPAYLGSFVWETESTSQACHFFWLQAAAQTSDRWDHRVSAGEQDKGMIFRYSFEPRSDSGLAYGFDSALDDLGRAITDRS